MLLQSVLGRAREGGRRPIVALALMAMVVTTGAVVGAGPSDAQAGVVERTTSGAATAQAPTDGFTVQVGPEQRVFGPSGLTDFPYFSERSGKTLLGFISNNDSYRTVQTRSGLLKRPTVIIKRGKPGSFDKCGAWLIGSVYKKPSSRTWIGTYHAEAAGKGDNNRCIFNDDSVVASIGRAVSQDAGKTWKKSPGGPVVTQDDSLNSPKTEDATLGRMIKVGDYLYLFYGASPSSTDTGRQLMVARSPVSELGARGTWRKWHCTTLLGQRSCDWSEPGLGGKSTPIAKLDPMARVMTPNTYLGHWIALAATGTKGFKLWVSNTNTSNAPVDPDGPVDNIAWAGSMNIYPLVSSLDDPQVDNWNRTKRAKQLYGYPSIVGLKGESHTSGQSFYIYYVKLFPGGDFPERYLMRRKVTLSKLDTSELNRVALTTYFRKSDGRRRSSTERPIQNAFRPQSQAGYLLAEEREGWVDVFECVRRGNFQLRQTKCNTGESKYRRVGWIRTTAGDGATVPIYRCFNRSKNNHFVTTSTTCGPGARRAQPGLLGYGLKSIT